MVNITKKSKTQDSVQPTQTEAPSSPIHKKILFFICNWVDTPSKTPLESPLTEFGSNIKITRVMCTSRVSRPLIIKAIEEEFEAIVILGCDECKNKEANIIAQKRIQETAALMKHTGIRNEFLYYKTILANTDIKKTIYECILELEKNS